tara:strand:- start:421 stop:789 length:369 start_codon:yes stop_codon:yes gene_type:complete
MKKKIETWFFALKGKRVLAFPTRQERNFWIYYSGLVPLNRIQVKHFATPAEINAAKRAWPNDGDHSSMQKFYKKKLSEIDEQYVRARRMRKLLKDVTGADLQRSAREAREKMDKGTGRMPRR